MRFVDILNSLASYTALLLFLRTKRESIMKATKIYFIDLGVRNALINTLMILISVQTVVKYWKTLFLLV